MAKDEIDEMAGQPVDPPVADPTRRVAVYKSEPRGLTVSDYLGRSDGGPEKPGNAPSTGGVEEPIDQTGPDEAELVGAMSKRSRSRAVAAAKGKLSDMVTPSGMIPPPGTQAAPGSPGGGNGEVAAPPVLADTPDLSNVTIPAAKTAVSVVKDVARGATEAPRQILGGVRDAAQATIDFADWITGAADNELIPIKDGVEGKPVKAGDKSVKVELPKVKPADSVTGGIVRGVSQFLAGFAGAGKVTGPLKAVGKAGPAIEATVKGVLANFVAFDAHQERLSNLIQQQPALANPVSEYLAAAPDDGEAEGRFKNAIEGLGLGALMEGLFKAVRYMRDAKRAQAASDPAQAAAREQAKPREAQPMLLLGDPDHADLLWQGDRAAIKPPALKVEPEFGVPDHTVALAVKHDALTPLSEGKNGVYVNFARIQSSDDVKAIIGKTAEAFKADIDAARRGVRSHEQTASAADKVDAWKELLDRRNGAAMNAETTLAARRLWEASAAKLIEVANVASHTPTPENLFQFRQMMAIHATIQQEVIAARTETARALNAWKIPVGAGGAERLRSVENVLQTYGGEGLAQDMAARIAALAKDPNGMAALADVVEKSALTKTREVATEVWINAILSNPKTHVVNMMGNGGAVAVEMVERAIAGRWSQAVGSGEIHPGEAAAKFFGLRQGIREGFSMFRTALRTSESQFGVESTKVADAGFERAIAASNFNAAGAWAKLIDGLGAVVNVPTRFLNAEDDFFKALAYRMEVNAQAFRTASQEVVDGALEAKKLNARIAELTASPPENIRLGAGDFARYQTFTTQPGAMVQALGNMEKKWAASSPGGQIGAFGMRLLIPFRNTPANLVKYSFERTPLAPLMGRYREAIAQGGAAADIARTRMAVGSTATLALVDYAFDGTITGGGPQGEGNKGTRETMVRAGWQPYSVKLGDRYYSYKRTDPFGMMVGAAADVAEIASNAQIDDDKAQSMLQATAMMSATFGNLLLAKNWMSGLSDFLDTLRNPNKSSNLYSRIASSMLVPAVLGEARRTADPYVRYTSSFVDDLRNKTPGLSSSLPPARDMWGRPRTYQSGMGTVYDAISPIASKLYKPDPIDEEAIKHDFNLTMPSKNVPYGNHLTVSLANRGEAYSRLLEIRGQVKPSEMYQGKDAAKLVKKYGDWPLTQLLNDIVTDMHPLHDEYEAGSSGRNGGKDQMISKIVAEYGKAARLTLLMELNEIKAVVERKKAKLAGEK